jgi:hypothetical protein
MDRRAVTGELSAERELVRLLLHRRQHVETVAKQVSPEHFRAPWLAKIFGRLILAPDETFESLMKGLDDDAARFFSALVETPGGLDEPAKIIKDSLSAFRQRDISEQMQELDRQMPLADHEAKDELTREKNRLLEELRTLGVPRHWKQFKRSKPQT